MTKKCFDDFASTVGKVLDNSEKENLLQKVRSNKEQLRIDGKEIDTTVGDKTALQKTAELQDRKHTNEHL